MRIGAAAAHHLVLNLVLASLLLTALLACRGILLVALTPHFSFAVSTARKSQNFSPTLRFSCHLLQQRNSGLKIRISGIQTTPTWARMPQEVTPRTRIIAACTFSLGSERSYQIFPPTPPSPPDDPPPPNTKCQKLMILRKYIVCTTALQKEEKLGRA